MAKSATAESGGPGGMTKAIRAAWWSRIRADRQRAFIENYVATFCATWRGGLRRTVIQIAIQKAKKAWILLSAELDSRD